MARARRAVRKFRDAEIFLPSILHLPCAQAVRAAAADAGALDGGLAMAAAVVALRSERPGSRRPVRLPAPPPLITEFACRPARPAATIRCFSPPARVRGAALRREKTREDQDHRI